MFELDETQRIVERSVRAWCEENLASAVPSLEAGDVLPYDLLRRLGHEPGASEPLVSLARRCIARIRGRTAGEAETRRERPPAAGLGGDPMLASVLLKEISRVSPGFGMVLIGSLGCAMAIVSRGSADLIERYALPVLRFDKVGAWGLTEPDAGNDAFGGMKTTAVGADEFGAS